LALGLRDDGHDVLVVLGQRGPVLERMERAGLRCIVAPMPLTDKWHWLRYLRARNELRRLFRREQPDVVHSNDLPTNQIVSDAARGLGMPRICHHRFLFNGPTVDWFIKFGAERHVFVSHALEEHLCSESARLRARPRAVVHDGLPLPPNPTAEQRRVARERLGLPKDRLVVTFAGQVARIKCVADLIQAWALLPAEQRAKAMLVIAGDDLQTQGSYRREMETLAKGLNCDARFVGFQKNIGEWLLASDLAVVPSHVEPLGNATLEAMSYALPVIGSAVGGIPEMVVSEETGLLVPPRSPQHLAAAIERCLTNEELRSRWGRQGRQRCEEAFSLGVHVRNIVQEYHLALEQPTRGVVRSPVAVP